MRCGLFSLALCALVCIDTCCAQSVNHIPTNPEMVLQFGLRGSEGSLAFSPDGSKLASRASGLITIWDVPSRTVICSFDMGPFWSTDDMNFSPDGKVLSTAGQAGSVTLWNPLTGKPASRLSMKPPPKGRRSEYHSIFTNAVAFSPDGNTVAGAVGASSPLDGEVELWDRRTGKLKRVLDGHTGEVISLAFSPDGSRIATGGRDRHVVLWDAFTGKMLRRLEEHDDEVRSICYSRDGRILATVDEDGVICIRDGSSGTVIRTLKSISGFYVHFRFIGDASMSVISNGGEEVLFLNVKTGSVLKRLSSSFSFAVTQDGGSIAAPASDGSVSIYNTSNLLPVCALKGLPDQHIQDVRISADGKLLATGEENHWCDQFYGEVRLWDFKTGAHVREMSKITREVKSVAFSAIGNTMATASSKWVNDTESSQVDLWNTMTGELQRTLLCNSKDPKSLSFSGDGTLLVVGGESVTVFEVESGIELYTIKNAKQGVFSPDNQQLIVASDAYDNRRVVGYASRTGEVIKILDTNKVGINSAAFSPNGSEIALGDTKGNVIIYNAIAGTRSASIKVGKYQCYAVAYAPDGRSIACVADGGLRFLRLTGQNNWSISKALDIAGDKFDYSPNGKVIAIAGWHSSVRILRATDGQLLVTLLPLPTKTGWIAYTPDRYFDGSSEVTNFIKWRIGAKVTSSKTLDAIFHRPDIIRKALKGER